MLAALDRVEDELATGQLRLRAHRRGHPHRHRAPGHRAGRARPAPSSTPGRSRNDQVATDLRLWAKRELARGGPAGRWRCSASLLERARDAGPAYLPGYTHLQRAQPVLLAHHLLAHGWALARDVDRLVDCRRRLDVSPLGAGALAGSSLPLDPDATAADLGFAGRFENSLDAVSDRDFVAEALFALAPAGRPPVAHGRGGHPVDDRRVRLRPPRRRLLDRVVDDAAEEEPRHRRAGPGQGRPA